jgi:hypothetical protein
LVEQTRKGNPMIWAPTGEPLFECPCCGYKTLSERGGYEICSLCKWEDEELEYPNPDRNGGANGDYSLNLAKKNFKLYGVKYHPSDPRFPTNPEYMQIKWQLQKLYAEIARKGPTKELYAELQDLSSKLVNTPRKQNTKE